MRRVVVTGLGIVSCLGNDLASVESALREGRPGISVVPEYAELGLRSQVAGIPSLGDEPVVDRKLRRFMGDAALYAYHAMRHAIADGDAVHVTLGNGGCERPGFPAGVGVALDAIAQLPDLVTLAFAPYGKALDKTVAVARGGGHEVMLEVPLEPFDFPQNDPGPHTLLTGEPPRENLEKLFWLMARFGGYFGIINNMGARFTASSGDFGPIMEELGARGVGYIDDGSSNRSVSQQLAGANKVPYARASMLIDANPARSSILSALASLEAEALEHGSAIGIVSALPISIQAVSEWSAALDGKGIALVPASALMQ